MVAQSISISHEKSDYLDLVASGVELPVFAMPWYLDAVSGKFGWRSVCVIKNDEIIGALPYILSKSRGFSAIINAKLQPYACLWYRTAADMKDVSIKSRESEVMKAIVGALPAVDRFNLKFYQNIQNWLPFYWEGYEQSTHYTNILPYSEEGMDKVRMEYKPSVRRALKKAANALRISHDVSIEELIRLGQLTFDRQEKKYPNDPMTIRTLYKALQQHGAGKLYGAIDQNNMVHSVILVAEDSQSAYYLLGGSEPELRNSGAMNLLLDKAIEDTQAKGKDFNFEGSMVEGIDAFFRSFGAVQQPVMKIVKNRHFLLKVYDFIQKL